MSVVDPIAASAAYRVALNQPGAAGAAGADAAAKTAGGGAEGGFAAALEEAATSAMETLQKSETVSMQAAAGEADLLEVVSAVNDAEATLRTVVSVRDKVVQSYQEILRMPI